jgi:hypothetical protein
MVQSTLNRSISKEAYEEGLYDIDTKRPTGEIGSYERPQGGAREPVIARDVIAVPIGGGGPNKLGLTTERQARFKELKRKEKELLDEMQRAGEISQDAIDRELEALTGQTGFQVDLANRATSANMYARGVGRSGLNVGAQARNIQKGQSYIRQAQTEAQNMKEKVKDNLRRTRENVIERRKRVQDQIRMLQLSSVNSEDYLRKTSQIKMDWEDFVANLEASKREQEALMNLFGGIGQLTGLGIGYSMTGGESDNKESE